MIWIACKKELIIMMRCVVTWTVPFPFRNLINNRVQAGHVVIVGAFITGQHFVLRDPGMVEIQFFKQLKGK
jgi:hypothetical protein